MVGRRTLQKNRDDGWRQLVKAIRDPVWPKRNITCIVTLKTLQLNVVNDKNACFTDLQSVHETLIHNNSNLSSWWVLNEWTETSHHRNNSCWLRSPPFQQINFVLFRRAVTVRSKRRPENMIFIMSASGRPPTLFLRGQWGLEKRERKGKIYIIRSIGRCLKVCLDKWLDNIFTEISGRGWGLESSRRWGDNCLMEGPKNTWSKNSPGLPWVLVIIITNSFSNYWK